MEPSEKKVRISVYRNRHEYLTQFFKTERGLVACNDTDGLMQTLNINHNPLDWRLLMDSSESQSSSTSQWQHPTFYSYWLFSG
jgi:uncharacterized protein (DUF2344 family)